MESESVRSVKRRLENTRQHQEYVTRVTERLEEEGVDQIKSGQLQFQSIVGKVSHNLGEDSRELKNVIKEVITNNKISKEELFLQLYTKNPLPFKGLFDKYFCQELNPSLRSLFWRVALENKTYTNAFKKVDKNLLEERQFEKKKTARLREVLLSLDTKLNNHELEFVNRLLEGCYKISSSIEASAFSLCVLLVKATHTEDVHSLGGCLISLLTLAQAFDHATIDTHISNLGRVLELIDQQSYSQLLVFNQIPKNKARMGTVLKRFVKSLGSLFLSQKSALLVLDNILAVGNNPMTIYILFSILVMILRSEEPEDQREEDDLDIASLIETKGKLIDHRKLQEVMATIYEGVDLYHIKTQAPVDTGMSNLTTKSVTCIQKLLEQGRTQIVNPDLQHRKRGVPSLDIEDYSDQPRERTRTAGLVPLIVDLDKL